MRGEHLGASLLLPFLSLGEGIPPLGEGIHLPEHTETWGWLFNMNELPKWAWAGAGKGWAMWEHREAATGYPRIFQCSERSPWQRSSSGRRPRQTLCPEGIPSPCAEGKLCFLLGKIPRQQSSAKVREGYVLAPRAAAATALPSAETARRRRRPKLTPSSRQRPPQSRTLVPWQSPLLPSSPGRCQVRGFEFGKGKRAKAKKDARDRAEVTRVIVLRSPSPTRARSPMRPPPAPGSRHRLPSRGHRSMPGLGGSPRGKLGPRALGLS